MDWAWILPRLIFSVALLAVVIIAIRRVKGDGVDG